MFASTFCYLLLHVLCFCYSSCSALGLFLPATAALVCDLLCYFCFCRKSALFHDGRNVIQLQGKQSLCSARSSSLFFLSSCSSSLGASHASSPMLCLRPSFTTSFHLREGPCYTLHTSISRYNPFVIAHMFTHHMIHRINASL